MKFLSNRKEKLLLPFVEELRNCREFYFSVAFITSGGIASIINILKELEKKEVKGKILTSTYLNFTSPEALKKLLKFKNIELKITTKDFHSKFYIFKNDTYRVILGSSNLTASAFSSNSEANLYFTPEKKVLEELLEEFRYEFDKAIEVDENFLKRYQKIYTPLKEINLEIKPNHMQQIALKNLELIRKKDNKALLISATGTGKTYLSAFDVKQLKPKSFLFVVHRHNIANKAKESFKKIINFDENKYIFTTIQTLVNNLDKYKKDEFEYIVIDETHRAAAKSYQKVLEYFKPKFLLGMTATPYRSDGMDIFSIFNHNIAYEIKLNDALREKMLTPFHYYGISDIEVDGELLDEKSDFNKLILDKRVEHIIKNIEFYGTDDGEIRGLVFCSRNEEAKILAEKFSKKGYKSIALSGKDREKYREEVIKKLENGKINYIFSVDIFNEGIDIPVINQIIMLRPTTSSIVFIQQLGRGLRKYKNKEYLTVLDFIGNYANNYLIAAALFNKIDKEKLKQFVFNENRFIEGESTIYFEEIVKEKIFESLNKTNFKKELVDNYILLKSKLNKIPMMCDYEEIEPFLFVEHFKSYFNFVSKQENITTKHTKLLELFSNEINNAKRVDESLLLKILLKKEIKIDEFKKIMNKIYGYTPNINSLLKNLNFEFISQKQNKKMVSVREIYGFDIVKVENETLKLYNSFREILKDEIFKKFLNDNINYSIRKFNKMFTKEKFFGGFILYEKYSRKDILRILNWDKNENPQAIGGYKVSKDKTNTPIFITFSKDFDNQIKDKEFITWFSKASRKLTSPDIKALKNTRIPLFIRKNEKEREFFYIGELTPISFKESIITNKNVVEVIFKIAPKIDKDIYNYLKG